MKDGGKPIILATPGSGSAGDPVRDECFRTLQTACAGLPIGSVLAAQIDSLGVSVAVVAEDRLHARHLVETIAKDLLRHIERNWETVKEHVAATQREPGHG